MPPVRQLPRVNRATIVVISYVPNRLLEPVASETLRVRKFQSFQVAPCRDLWRKAWPQPRDRSRTLSMLSPALWRIDGLRSVLAQCPLQRGRLVLLGRRSGGELSSKYIWVTVLTPLVLYIYAHDVLYDTSVIKRLCPNLCVLSTSKYVNMTW